MVATNPRNASGASHTTSFQHEPLDYRRSAIRLLRILPNLSNDGHIQCEMWHDSVKSSYTCLSYVWGSEKIQRQILVNGRLLSIRENLYEYMRVARSKYANPPRTLWIDALCIDQNSVYERNHQVAQMGSVYANSVEVISWLGLNQSIERAFTFALDLSMDPRYGTWDMVRDQEKRWLQRNNKTNGQLKRDWSAVLEDRYWTRAWITQEILLAQNVKFLVNNLEVTFKQIAGCAVGQLEYFNGLEGNRTINHENFDVKTRVFWYYMCSIGKQRKPSESKLISWFTRLPGRQSCYVHDRVYSLLSLASDASSIKVDYRTSRSELLHQVMSLYKTKMCICAWFYMVDMLDCYHVPGTKGRGNGSDITPIFRLPMKPVRTESVMGYNIKDWYDTCSACATRMPPPFDEKVQTTFCVKSLCCNIQAGHIHVYKNKREKYVAERWGDTTSYEVVQFRPGNPGTSKDDIDLGWGSSPDLYDIFITGDVLMKLFLYPDERVRKAVPLQICSWAQEGVTNMELY